MDIFTRIKDDHDKARSLGEKIADTSGDSAERRKLFDQLIAEIEAHAAAEEMTFYQELIGFEESQEQARHSIAEHKDAADLLKELSELDMSSSSWLTIFKKLQHELEHHMDEEEEDVFALGRQLIDTDKANELGQAFESTKADQLAS
jgi:hypothetical protein